MDATTSVTPLRFARMGAPTAARPTMYIGDIGGGYSGSYGGGSSTYTPTPTPSPTPAPTPSGPVSNAVEAVCQALFKKVSPGEVSSIQSEASSIASQTGTKMNFKQRPADGGRVEVGVQFCGSQYDVERALSMLKA